MRIMALAHQLLALRHPELVLLVNNHQPKVVRHKPALDQRVRPDSERWSLQDAGCRMLTPNSWLLTSDFGLHLLEIGRLPASRSPFHRHAQDQNSVVQRKM